MSGIPAIGLLTLVYRVRICGKKPPPNHIYLVFLNSSFQRSVSCMCFCNMKRTLQLCCWTLNKCSKLKTTVWKSQTSRMHSTRQGIFFTAEFQNSILSEFNHKATVLQFSILITPNSYLQKLARNAGKLQHLQKAKSCTEEHWLQTKAAVSQAHGWDGRAQHREAVRKVCDPSVTCHAQGPTCCLKLLLPFVQQRSNQY